MSNLTADQVTEITTRINARLAEFGKIAPYMPELSCGVVRITFDVIEEWMARTDYLGEDGEPGQWPVVPTPVDGDPMMDGYHIGYHRGYAEARRVMSPMRDEAEDKRLVTNSAPAADDEGEPMPPIEDHIRTILARWLQLMGALAEDLQESDNAVGAGQLLAEILTLRTTFDLYDAAGIGELAAHWPDLAHVEEGDDVFAEHPHPEGSQGAPDAPQKSDENLTSEEPPTASPEPYPAGSRKSTIGEPVALSPSAATTLGPEHTVVTPLKVGARPRMLAEVDRESNGTVPGKRDKREQPTARGTVLPDLAALVKEVQRQAMGGVMPSQAVFNGARPANWATATAHLVRLGISWQDLAKEAGLRQRGR